MKINKFISIFLIISIISSVFSVSVSAADKDLNYAVVGNDNREMPFRPEDKYVSQQNPPTFLWPKVKNIDSFELVVCSDKELKDVKYRKDGIKTNFYSFDCIFETGVQYYWAVRTKKGSKVSEWSDARRFRIDPDAVEFPVEDIEVLAEKIPQSHPRIYATPETLEDFRNMKNKNATAKKVYDTYMKKANDYIKNGTFPDEPVEPNHASEADKVVWGLKLVGEANKLIDIVKSCGFAYLLSGDEKIGRFGVEALVELSGWDIYGVTSYETQDQVHRMIAYESAKAYDWLYPIMTEDERQTALDMITERTKIMEYLLDELKDSPYESHGWTAFGYIGIVAIATYRDVPEAEKWLKTIVPAYTAMLPVWSYEDGGWSQGTDYWQYSSTFNKEFMEVVKLVGMTDMYKKAWQQNEYLWQMYAYPEGSFGSFGDQSNWNKASSVYSGKAMINMAAFTGNGYAKWLAGRFEEPTVDVRSYVSAISNSVEEKSPKDFPLAHEFSDIGWAIMTDDVINPDRIQLSFKSSPYGSFNHSEADHNSFIIQAYGENLAVKSGWYDYYHSTHNSGFTRKTSAHNSVTVATNRGQRDDSFNSKGKLTNFLNHVDFDLVSGDATQAYFGALDKFERSIVYIRPDIFVVIDNLDTAGSEKSQFEWWLQANHDIEVYDNLNGARLTEGIAVLDAIVQYPQKVKTYYNNTYAASDMKEYPTDRYKDFNVQRRVWFETEKVENTKMVVTMDVHKSGTEARFVDTEYYNDYVKMTFEDGTIMLVNLKNNDEVVRVNDIIFKGAAVVYNDESVMLVSGTTLSMGGIELIKNKEAASVVIGKNEMGISTYEDNQISINVNNDYISEISSVTDYNGRHIGKEYGIYMESGIIKEKTAEEKVEYIIEDKPDYVTFTAEKDNYTLMLNGNKFVSESVEGLLKLSIDGKITDYVINGQTKRDGGVSFSGNISFPASKYFVKNKNKELNFNGINTGDNAVLSSATVSSSVKDNFIELEKVKSIPVSNVAESDIESAKNRMTVFVEAEDYTDNIADGAKVYNTRAFMSGGAGVHLFNTPGTQMKYKFNVPESGKYSLAITYVTFGDDPTIRSYNINGIDYEMTLEKTAGYGVVPDDWKTAICNNEVELEKGEYIISLEAIGGNWNIDWLGLIKR